jgi:hypothetical protein
MKAPETRDEEFGNMKRTPKKISLSRETICNLTLKQVTAGDGPTMDATCANCLKAERVQ